MSSSRRRPYGTGSLFVSRGKWYGKWRVDGRQTKRLLGPKRQPGSREGLTRKMAEVQEKLGELNAALRVGEEEVEGIDLPQIPEIPKG